MCICIPTSFLVRASHYGYEQASLEIFREILYIHSCLSIFLYNELLLMTKTICVGCLPGLPNLVNANTNFGVLGTTICVIIHMIQ